MGLALPYSFDEKFLIVVSYRVDSSDAYGRWAPFTSANSIRSFMPGIVTALAGETMGRARIEVSINVITRRLKRAGGVSCVNFPGDCESHHRFHMGDAREKT
jgi:hypothetical protein